MAQEPEKRRSAASACSARRWVCTHAEEQYLKSRRANATSLRLGMGCPHPSHAFPARNAASAASKAAFASASCFARASEAAFRVAARVAFSRFTRSRARRFFSLSFSFFRATSSSVSGSGTRAACQSNPRGPPPSPRSARCLRKASLTLPSLVQYTGTRPRLSSVVGSLPAASKQATRSCLPVRQARWSAVSASEGQMVAVPAAGKTASTLGDDDEAPASVAAPTAGGGGGRESAAAAAAAATAAFTAAAAFSPRELLVTPPQ
mmetsp:Transcript_51874/g.102936  ORF Transcript_51874/g.102936 Transcript_51874/m.102936 type:complete len:263 (-) Transcript_51874:299-1087(-)